MRKALVLGISLGWTGCDLPPVSCTEIGCVNGLSIEVATAETGDRDIDVTVEVGGETFACAGAFDAVDGLSCGDVYVAPTTDGFAIRVPTDADPPTAHLTVGDYDTEVALDWETSFPNGEDCPPECRQGTGAATVP